MSHDLYFYCQAIADPPKKGLLGRLIGSGAGHFAVPAGEDLIYFLASYGNVKIERNEHGFDGAYYNENTGAMAHLHYDRGKAGPTGDPGFFDTGLSLNINYFRPFFFGFEAALAAGAICRQFGLCVCDPLDDGRIIPGNVEDIFSSWDRSNTSTVRGQIQALISEGKENVKTNPDIWTRMSRSSSRARWQLIYYHGAIAEHLEQQRIKALVPAVYVFLGARENRLLTGVPLKEGRGYVIPQCDLFYVMLEDGSKAGFVESAALLEAITDALKPLDMPGMDLQYLTSVGAGKISGVLRNIPLDDNASKGYLRLRVKNSLLPGIYIDID